MCNKGRGLITEMTLERGHETPTDDLIPMQNIQDPHAEKRGIKKPPAAFNKDVLDGAIAPT